MNEQQMNQGNNADTMTIGRGRRPGGPPPEMEGSENGDSLANAPVRRLMIRFAVPSIIGMLVGALYNIIDQLFIGHKVGPLGNAATNIAFPLTTACTAMALLFGIGGASCFNLSMGMGDKKRAGYYVGNAVSLLAGCGIILSAVTLAFLDPMLKMFGSDSEILPYAHDYVQITAIGFPFLILTTGGGHLVRADGSPHMVMIGSLIGAVINTVLDAIFILGFDWGMKGAAVATVIGQVVSAAIVLIYIKNFKTIDLEKEHFVPAMQHTKRVAMIGMASFFNQIAIGLVQIVLNNSLRHYGADSRYGSSDPIAVAGIVMKVNMIIFSVVIGLAQGTQPIVGFNYGARKFDRVREAYWLALRTGAFISLIAFAMFQLFPRQILSIFGGGSETYYDFGVKFFRIFLFFTCLNALQPITSTFFTSIGKSIKGVFLSLTRQIIFFIPTLIILPKFLQIDGIVYTGPIADFASAIVAVAMALDEFADMRRIQQQMHDLAAMKKKA